jgi:hypothetical protein
MAVKTAAATVAMGLFVMSLGLFVIGLVLLKSLPMRVYQQSAWRVIFNADWSSMPNGYVFRRNLSQCSRAVSG